MKIKIGIDLLMTVMLICLMAYQITGEVLHEWFGAGMLILFIAHNILNIHWYGRLLSGTYNALRIFQTIVNLSVMIAGYGLFCFIRKDIASYMFLKNQFVFLDFEQSAFSVFTEYFAMMGFWIFISFYVIWGIGTLISIYHKNSKQ